MLLRSAARLLLLAFLSFSMIPGVSLAQPVPISPRASNAQLEFVVMLTRHGVRSPLASQEELDKFSAAPWPRWEVAPGIQTAHGNELIRIMGSWDRAHWSQEGFLASSGCADSDRVFIFADTEQRTRETGTSLAEGMFPGCNIEVHALPGNTIDPLFRPLNTGLFHPDSALAVAAVEGRIGGDPKNLTEAYRPQLAALDRVLAGCGKLPVNSKRTSIFDIQTSLKAGSGTAMISSRSPLATASTFAENLLLEYAQGMSDADTGWGCLDGATLRYLMQLDTAGWEFASRTPAVARMNASSLLAHIEKTLQQGASGKPVAGAVGKPGDKLVILAGHDSNIAAVAGALHIDWVLDGRVDDTPPGGALIFQLWRSPGSNEPFIRVFYRAQTLEQMRNAQMLTAANPPDVAPIFIPGCSRQDLSCKWSDFSALVNRTVQPAYVTAQP